MNRLENMSFDEAYVACRPKECRECLTKGERKEGCTKCCNCGEEVVNEWCTGCGAGYVAEYYPDATTERGK
jgi:hypothetical protein